MVSEMFTEAGVEERKTNHSLRAAGVSRLFEAGMDEEVHSELLRSSTFGVIMNV